MSFTVVIYVFPNVEVLDFAGPFEVFTTASRVQRGKRSDAEDLYHVVTASSIEGPIRARAGLRVLPDYTLKNCPRPDILLVPGGVVDAEVVNQKLLSWIQACARSADLVASVCTGAFILARSGLLSGKCVTTHWEDVTDLRSQFPDLTVVEGVRWIDEGNVVTSAGIAAGIDMSLHLVARTASPDLARATARQLDVPYRDDA